ncbi:MAG TPA: hypothetical protein VN326_03165 [Casimicrobiaceae bacterium]|nr:hypothetical protein [Casimicrobiaceae bacterium]
MAQPSRGQRSLDGVIDPLQPLRVALATAAMPREQPFSRGSSTGAFGQNPTVAALLHS